MQLTAREAAAESGTITADEAVPALFAATACDKPMSDPSDMNSKIGTAASADGVPIEYEVHGDGDAPALVLIHGWSCDRSYWSQQVGPLSEHHKVVTSDLGGHGESGLGREDWTIDSFGADVATVISALDLESVVLVGHSMGGDVIFQAARRLPERVRLLVMADTYKQLGAPRSDEEINAFVARLEADFAGVTEGLVRGMFPAGADPALIERVARDMASAPPAVALSAIRSSFRHAREMPELLEQLHIPVVAINPDDAPTDRASMEKHGVDVEIMPGVGHFLMMDDPAAFNEVILSAVAEHSTRL